VPIVEERINIFCLSLLEEQMKSQDVALEMELFGKYRGHDKKDKRSKESCLYDDDEDKDFDVDEYDPDKFDEWN